MVEFGKELLAIESSMIPWLLIWIQLLAFLLLTLLLCSFTQLFCSSSDLSSSDDFLCPPSSSSSTSSSSSSSFPSLHGNHHSQELQLQVREVTTSDGSSGTSRKLNGAADIHREEVNEINKEEEEEHKEEQRSASAKGRSISTESMYSNNHHPCNLVRLAKVALLKCLGLRW